MMNQIEELLKDDSLLTAKILLSFYDELIRIEFDPISIEILVDRTNLNEDFDDQQIDDFIYKLIDVFKTIDFDNSSRLLRMLPRDYKKIVKLIENNLEDLRDIVLNKNKIIESKNFEDEKVEELATILKKMYLNAPYGFQMTMVHLFGIKYVNELEKVSVKKVSIKATGKDSLWVEISKGIKLSKYVKINENEQYSQYKFIKDNQMDDIKKSEITYSINFNSIEKEILKKYNLEIKSNKRNYIYHYSDKGKKTIYGGGKPRYFKCMEFEWEGNNWNDLLLSFTKWILKKIVLSENDFLNIKFNWTNQEIFSRTKRTNFIGPFENDLYLNANHTAVHIWWQILGLADLLTDLDIENTYLKVYYPSRVEPKEISEIIWRKEINSFIKFLTDQNHSEIEIKNSIQALKKVNTIYKIFAPNYIFSNINGIKELNKAFSRLQRLESYKNEYFDLHPHIIEFVKFKKVLLYNDCIY